MFDTSALKLVPRCENRCLRQRCSFCHPSCQNLKICSCWRRSSPPWPCGALYVVYSVVFCSLLHVTLCRTHCSCHYEHRSDSWPPLPRTLERSPIRYKRNGIFASRAVGVGVVHILCVRVMQADRERERKRKRACVRAGGRAES